MSTVSPVCTSEGKKDDTPKEGTNEDSETVRSLPTAEGTVSFETYLSETNKSKPTRNK